jgi:hypothetical protein
MSRIIAGSACTPTRKSSNDIRLSRLIRLNSALSRRAVALARKGTPRNGHDRLDEAMALLIQNQAAFVNRLAETDRAHAEFQRKHLEFERETAERFARIEVQIAEILRVLAEQGRLLERRPEAVRDKIGFKEQP